MPRIPFSERMQNHVADIQIVASLICLIVFFFLNTHWRIFLIGVVTMVTWTGTALAHKSGAEANEKLVVDKDDDGQ